MTDSHFLVRAVRARQGEHEVFAFFVPGSRLLEIADISRLAPGEHGKLAGFQRQPIQDQVRSIAEYLAKGPALFPNAIVLALAPTARFVETRGPRGHRDGASEAGTLTIPLRSGRAAAWIVDGQQRTLAVAKAGDLALPIPVVAFVSDELNVQREQFILVNKARPLPRGLIDELLPEVHIPLPRDLSARRMPSYLCTALNELPDSPFRGLIKRPSLTASTAKTAVVTDSALIRAIGHSIHDPRGALAAYVADDGIADVEQMVMTLTAFWSAVRTVFSDAWALTPDRSRLMHSAGIEAMGILMDQIVTRHPNDYGAIRASLERIAPECHWTSGRWSGLGREWNDIQTTRRDVRLLANHLIALDRRAISAA